MWVPEKILKLEKIRLEVLGSGACLKHVRSETWA